MRREVLEELRSIVGDDWVVEEIKLVERYLLDETAEPVRPSPSSDIVLVKPGDTEEIAEIVRLANRYRVPIFPRGGGTGLVGGCIPTSSGIVLSLERMDSIEVDRDNLMAIAEAGVTLGKLIEVAEKADLFFPAHPGDEGAFIGGLIACNAGGARAVRTGVMRNYIVGLEVVLPTGEVLSLGGKLVKNNSEYSLMHLFIGTEGTLGIITKAIIRLYPKFGATATLIVPFNTRREAIQSVPKILQSGIIPLAIEYVERDLVERSAKKLGLRWPCDEGKTFLIIILAEFDQDTVYLECERIDSICKQQGALEPLIAESRREQEEILKIRSEIYTTLKPETVDILDVVVPPARIGDLMDMIDEIERKYGIYIPVYGHAGDGNLHPHIMKYENWTMEQYERIREEIYRATISLGGAISGEHGIGAIRRRYLKKYLSETHIELIRKLKKLLDPNNILNPGKVIP